MSNSSLTTPRRGFSAVPFLGDLLVLTRLLRDKDAHFGLKVLALATIAYVVSPIDLIPEAVMPLIAWIDDVGLVLAVRAMIDGHLTKYRYPLFEAPPRAALAQPPVRPPHVPRAERYADDPAGY